MLITCVLPCELVCEIKGSYIWVSQDGHYQCFCHVPCTVEIWPFSQMTCFPYHTAVTALLHKRYRTGRELECSIICHCWGRVIKLASKHRRVALWEDSNLLCIRPEPSPVSVTLASAAAMGPSLPPRSHSRASWHLLPPRPPVLHLVTSPAPLSIAPPPASLPSDLLPQPNELFPTQLAPWSAGSVSPSTDEL